MTDPITITATPTYNKFDVTGTLAATQTEGSLLASRKGVAFRNAGTIDVYIAGGTGAQTEYITLEPGDQRAYIIESSVIVTFYFAVASGTGTIEREEWL